MDKIIIHRWKFVAHDYVSTDPSAKWFESGEIFEEFKKRSFFPGWPDDEKYDAEKRPVLIKERLR